MEREQFMKERLMACVEEANTYSRTLQEPYAYKINLRVEDEHLAGTYLSKYLDTVRYDQIFVEILNTPDEETGIEPGSGSATLTHSKDRFGRIMSGERFFEKHNELYSEIKKRRSLMPKSKAFAERLRDRDLAHTRKDLKNMSENSRENRQNNFIDMPDLKQKGKGEVMTKEVAHAKLRRILLKSLSAGDEIRNQIKEIRLRGWNMS